MKQEYFQLTGIQLTDSKDSVLIDCLGMDEIPVYTKIQEIIYFQNVRMIQMGIKDFQRVLVAQEPIIKIFDKYKYTETKLTGDNHAPDNVIFILILSIDGRPIIHPPYSPGHQGIMSWGEYFVKITNGEKIKLMNRCPYLQAKLTNVKI